MMTEDERRALSPDEKQAKHMLAGGDATWQQIQRWLASRGKAQAALQRRSV